MKLYFVAALYAGWLFLINFIFYAVHGQGLVALELVVLAGAAPMAMQVLVLGFNSVGMTRPAGVLLAFLVIILASYLVNGVGWAGLIYVVGFLYLAAGSILIAGCPNPRLLVIVAEFYSIPTALWLLYIDHSGPYLWGRLAAGDLQPNAWGLMGLSVGIAAFGHRSRITGGFCFAAAALTAYDASSRSSIVGLVAGAAFVGVRYLAEIRSRKFIGAIAIIAVGFVGLAIVLPSLQHVLFDSADNVFKLDDPRRGLGTGGTGRDVFWRAALALWWNHPLLGVGFRMHEQYMPLDYESHNAFIAMLADTGILGLVWYVGLLAAMFRGAFKIADTHTRRLAIAIVSSYAIVGLFERRAIDGANPMSWLFLMAAMLTLREMTLANAYRVAAAGWRRLAPRMAGGGASA